MQKLNRFAQFTAAISAIYRDVQRIEREEMEKYGLKGAYAQYLAAMRRYPEGLTAAALCEICDKDKAAVSRVTAEMEQRDLLTRADEKGAYRALLRLTPQGEEAADYVCRKAEAAVELAGGSLSETERTALYAALGRIAEALQTICRDGLPDQL